MNVNIRLYEGVVAVVSTALCGAAIWNMETTKRRLSIIRMRGLRSICGVAQMAQVRIWGGVSETWGCKHIGCLRTGSVVGLDMCREWMKGIW